MENMHADYDFNYAQAVYELFSEILTADAPQERLNLAYTLLSLGTFVYLSMTPCTSAAATYAAPEVFKHLQGIVIKMVTHRNN